MNVLTFKADVDGVELRVLRIVKNKGSTQKCINVWKPQHMHYYLKSSLIIHLFLAPFEPGFIGFLTLYFHEFYSSY